MKRRTKIALVLLNFAILFAIMSTFFSMWTNRSASRARGQFEAKITKLLPIGTRQEEVLTRLTTEGVEHSPYFADTRQILLMKREAARNQIVQQDLQVILTFDAKGLLTGMLFKDVYTGP